MTLQDLIVTLYQGLVYGSGMISAFGLIVTPKDSIKDYMTGN